jgi:hypothetical protein
MALGNQREVKIALVVANIAILSSSKGLPVLCDDS